MNLKHVEVCRWALAETTLFHALLGIAPFDNGWDSGVGSALELQKRAGQTSAEACVGCFCKLWSLGLSVFLIVLFVSSWKFPESLSLLSSVESTQM